MSIALEEARAAALRGEVPVGAAVVDASGMIVARAGNRTRELSDPTAHAELLALRAACAGAGSERLPGHSLFVTLEPCPMCAAALASAFTMAHQTRNRAGSRRARGFSRIRNAITSPKSMTGLQKSKRRHCCPTFFAGCGATIRPACRLNNTRYALVLGWRFYFCRADARNSVRARGKNPVIERGLRDSLDFSILKKKRTSRGRGSGRSRQRIPCGRLWTWP